MDLISLVLLNAEIPLGDLVGGVIVQVHQHGRRRSLLPSIITEGFSQGMAAYMFGQTTAFCRFPDNAVCLRAREGTGFIASAGKQKILRRGFGAEAPVGVKRLMQDGVDGNRSCFSCFCSRTQISRT